MTDVNELVRSYLEHEGYSEALTSFVNSAALPVMWVYYTCIISYPSVH